jgi:tRNA nucleotidyltransferase (CCA-adding enzyme)
MKSTKIDPSLQKILKNILDQHRVIKKIVEAINAAGGQALLVGGAVRDLLLGSEIKDLDIEVHGITIEQLQKILEQFGPVSLIGKSFGVLRLHGLDIDWSLPRKDEAGRKPHVVIDPSMSMIEAFRRRDLTINAMGIDLNSFELIDPFNGYADLKAGILRAPDKKLFIEDPLRLFRVMQFLGRFAMKPDEQLNEICASMDIKGVSTERIEAEFDKLFLKSENPSLGIRWLLQIGRLKEILPELAATIGIQQDPKWHPEGDVFEHTMQAIDAAANLDYKNSAEKLILMYAALCHDLGKVTTTEKIDDTWRSFQHENAGIEPAKSLLHRLTRRIDLIEAVIKLVKHHMAPGQFIANHAKIPAYKRLAHKLAPQVTIEILVKLALADRRGRNPEGHQPLEKDFPEIDEFLKNAQQAHVNLKPEDPILHGRDLFGIIEPGPEMGKLLKEAYEIQIEHGIKDKEELLKRIIPSKKN